MKKKLGDKIEEMVTNNPQLSIRQSAARADISKSGCQVAVKQLHFKPYRPTFIVDLNDDGFDRHNEFCESWVENFEDDSGVIYGIFWNDKAKFNMNTTVNQHNCICWVIENLHLKFEVLNTEQGIVNE